MSAGAAWEIRQQRGVNAASATRSCRIDREESATLLSQGDSNMRVIIGMILGSALTIAGAYLHDTVFTPAPASPQPTAQRPMVNWDVVDANARHATGIVREQWDRLRRS
jgi:hypothetical protein